MRRKQGGNKKMCFTEGWVEFCDKKIAKHVAKCLNASQIGKDIACLVLLGMFVCVCVCVYT